MRSHEQQKGYLNVTDLSKGPRTFRGDAGFGDIDGFSISVIPGRRVVLGSNPGKSKMLPGAFEHAYPVENSGDIGIVVPSAELCCGEFDVGRDNGLFYRNMARGNSDRLVPVPYFHDEAKKNWFVSLFSRSSRESAGDRMEDYGKRVITPIYFGDRLIVGDLVSISFSPEPLKR
jgi:hypothetical protein